MARLDRTLRVAVSVACLSGCPGDPHGVHTVLALLGGLAALILGSAAPGVEWCVQLAISFVVETWLALVLRGGLLLSTLLHEWAHLAAALAAGLPLETTCTTANLTGNVAQRVWLQCMHPFQRLPCSFLPHVWLPALAGGAKSPGQSNLTIKRSQARLGLVAAWVHCSGAAASVALAAGLTLLLQQQSTWLSSSGWFTAASQYQRLPQRLSANQYNTANLLEDAATQLLVGFWLTAIAGLGSDLLGWGRGSSSKHRFWCGNFGLMLLDAAEPGMNVIKVLQAMAAISVQRGAQSGGLVALMGAKTNPKEGGGNAASRGVRARVRGSKRGDLAGKLAGSFWRRLMFSGTTLRGPGIFAGHTRFATSSEPKVSETHPHTWSPPRPAAIWHVAASSDGTPVLQEQPARQGLYVTHNGDFEFYTLFGREVTCEEVMVWLSAVLDEEPPALCDTVGVAGMLQLLRTQGLWAESLRLAYQQTVAGTFDDAVMLLAESAAPANAAAAGSVKSSGRRHSTELSRSLKETKSAKFVRELEGGDAFVEGAAWETCGPPTRKELQEAGAAASEVLRSFLAERQERQTELTAGSSLKGWDSGALNEAINLKGGCGVGGDKGTSDASGDEMLEALGGAPGLRDLERRLQAELTSKFMMEAKAGRGGRHLWVVRIAAKNLWRAFLGAALRNFTSNSLYAAVQHFFGKARGSFGLAVVSELDAGRLCLAALNQPMTVSFCLEHRMVLYSSESQGTMINVADACTRAASEAPVDATRNSWRPGHPTHRIDMAEGQGEVFLLELLQPADGPPPRGPGPGDGGGWDLFPDNPEVDTSFLRLSVFNMRSRQPITRDQFLEAGRLVPLQGNAYVPFRRPGTSHYSDAVEQDLAEIPAVLDLIRESWQEATSFNRQTARELMEMLQEIMDRHQTEPQTPRSGWEGAPGTRTGRPVDVLVTGVEVSLWVAEQFCSDLQVMFPDLRVLPISANKVIGVLGNARGNVAPTGFSFCKVTGRLEAGHTVALCISQSGQTFPTIHAARILEKALPGRVFVVGGSLDTKMSLIVGHAATPGAPFCQRIFNTYAGWRSAEPPTLTVLAAHHCLTELLTFLAASTCAQRMAGAGAERLETTLTPRDIANLAALRDAFIDTAVPDLVGHTCDGYAHPTDTSRALKAQGRAWAWHILETPLAWFLSFAYIMGTVIGGYPLFKALAHPIHHAAPLWVAHVLDGLFYSFCPLIFALLLRLLQRRPLLARLGKRTLVVCDVPYVHQVLETYVSKLFALSYAIATIDVHGANPVDHFVHRFTHRVARGLLLAIGRPDGRLCSQTKNESWVLLALLQAKVIANLGNKPEVVTVGHNPYTNPATMDHSLVLPTRRTTFLCEALVCGNDALFASNPNALQASLSSFKKTADEALAEQQVDLGAAVSALMGSGASGSKKSRSLPERLRASSASSSSMSFDQRLVAMDDSALHVSEAKTMRGRPSALRRKKPARFNSAFLPASLAPAPKTVSFSPETSHHSESAAPAPAAQTNPQSIPAPVVATAAAAPQPAASGPRWNSAADALANALLRSRAETRAIEAVPAARQLPQPGESTASGANGGGAAAGRAYLRSGSSKRRLLKSVSLVELPRPEAVIGQHLLRTAHVQSMMQAARDKTSTLLQYISFAVQERAAPHHHTASAHAHGAPAAAASGEGLHSRRGNRSGRGGRISRQESILGSLGPSGLVAPRTQDLTLNAMDASVTDVLESQSVLEQLTENRFLSAERLLAFMVIFHAMVRPVARLWPLSFDLSRSQSGLRIASTAAPVSASDLERMWQESEEVELRRSSSRGAAQGVYIGGGALEGTPELPLPSRLPPTFSSI